MITANVEKAPPYLALSYTWASKECSRVIQVNGFDLAITADLGDALDHIYSFAKERKLLFWVDSICINQADIHERSRQVRLMDLIYALAKIVGVWLGKAADDSQLAFEVMKEWQLRLEMIRKDPRFKALTEDFLANEEPALTTLCFGSPQSSGQAGAQREQVIRATLKLTFRDWWTRAWMVQEGTIADSSKTILICGESSVDWLCFRAGYTIMPLIKSWRSENRAIKLDGFRYMRERGCGTQLLNVLGFMRQYKCEDPRDKVYAALGMAMDVDESDILPDYTKGCLEVYIDVPRFLISKIMIIPWISQDS